VKQDKKRKFVFKDDNSRVTITIIIFLSSLSVLAILYTIGENTLINAISQAKEKTSSLPLSLPSSSLPHHNTITKESNPKVMQFSKEGSAVRTEPLNFTSIKNYSAHALAIANHLYITSINASKTQGRFRSPCLPEINKFIKPQKESRFTIVKSCVTVTGKVSWTNYFNDDGDANFNVVLDSPYKDVLGLGNYGQAFSIKYGVPALHVEVVYHGPVTSISPENVGACNGYKDPNFKHVLPKIGYHVMVTGRYLVEIPEMPGGITELHPAYDIKVLH
jgi:hypothetical protein